MGKKSPEILDFQKTYGITEAEMWEVRPGSWAVKHSAIERIIAEKGIKFDRPAIIEVNTAEKIMVICVFGTMGDRTEWSFGEASPANCKIAYPASIAEKRAKDRVAIKLLNATGAAIYSDEEGDFEQHRQNPHVTRPEDIVPVSDEVIIPHVDGVEKLTVDAQRPIFEELQDTLWKCGSEAEMKRWITASKAKAARLSESWKTTLNGLYIEHRDSIRQQDAADSKRLSA